MTGAAVAGGAATPRAARFHALDLVRFAVALAVVVFHYGFRGYAADGLSAVRFDTLGAFARYGYLGVNAFFVVSGYVIAQSAEGRTAGAFAWARARRLVPALWVCCLLTAAGAWVSGQPAFAVTVPELLGNLSMARIAVGSVAAGLVDGAYWSLQVELRFYAMVALLLWWRPRAIARTLPAATALWMALAAADYLRPIPYRHGALWLQYAPLFAAGVSYAAVARGRAGWRDWAALAVAVPLSVAYALRDAAAQSAHYHAEFAPAVVAGVLCLTHLGFGLATVRGWDVRPSRLWPALGAVTYPLYLVHQHLGYMVLNATRGRVAPAVVFVPLVVGMVGVAFAVARAAEPRVLAGLDSAAAWCAGAFAARPHARRASPRRSAGAAPVPLADSLAG
ncbi:hypothetical protein tb265_41930 [Gemmatimonadetes bacterium T265]|nr:hypothetical protein tb265_41930 [Gemmatimonadetes bacterium T265]